MTRTGRALTYAALTLWSVVCLVPIVWVAITSVKGLADIDKPPGYLPFVDFAPSLDAWRFILFAPNDNLVRALANSAVIAVAATGLTVTVAAMAIYGLTRFARTMRWSAAGSIALVVGAASALAVVPAPARPALAALALGGVMLALWGRGPRLSPAAAVTLLLASRALPPVVLVVPLYVLSVATGLRDTRAMMILLYAAANLPVALWLMLPAFGPRATDQEEAAQLDGASHGAILTGIVLPMIRPSIAAAAFVVFLLCWNEYLFAAVLTADRALTLPPWAAGQLSMKEAQVGGGAEELAHLSAATVLMILPALALAAFVQRQIGRSVTGTRQR